MSTEWILLVASLSVQIFSCNCGEKFGVGSPAKPTNHSPKTTNAKRNPRKQPQKQDEN
jgi:hypothetical protein